MYGTTTHFPVVEARWSPPARAGVRSAFTLMEILIVVVVVGLLATVVIPQFSSASQHDRQNTLKDELQYLRTQVAVFKAQHQEVPPGYPNGNPASVPEANAFASQMTGQSDVNCNVSMIASPNYQYGPYLRHMPVNPVNNSSAIIIVGNNQKMPVPNGATGWIYKPQTQEILANLIGKDDAGTPYSTY